MNSALNLLVTVLVICLLASIALFLTSCAVDLNQLSRNLKKPDVSFARADQWRCDEEIKIPNGAAVDTCSRCVNAGREPQPVTIANVEQTVKSGGSVMLCPTRAWVTQ
jgi:hypothetical protein